MRKNRKRILICGVIPILLLFYSLVSIRCQLRNNLVRFHVVANSDSDSDQTVKLKVRDAVIEYIQKDLQNFPDADSAKRYLKENIPQIQKIANDTLHSAGSAHAATVTVCTEAFPTRVYETFSLPSGVYDSLRITIGEGKGRNWWCVTFPDLCLPATSAGFADTAVGAGFSKELSETLSAPEEYEIRFFLLDAIGQLENILWKIE